MRFVTRQGHGLLSAESSRGANRSDRLANRLNRTPLRSDAWIGEGTQKIGQGVAITWIGQAFTRLFRLQFFHVLRQDRMWQAGTLVMDSVKWFVQETECEQTPEPALRDDAAG